MVAVPLQQMFPPCTAFDGERCLAAGSLDVVALAVKAAVERGADGPLLIFSDVSGRVVDVDTRGSQKQFLARLARSHGLAAAQEGASEAAQQEIRGPGRPRLGVVAREVTLLPRHWEWLSAQPGGASVALRQLVEAARRDGRAADALRQRRDAAYHFMSAMAGDYPGFEEASRALFSGDGERLRKLVARWPRDVRDHLLRLAFPTASNPASGPAAAETP